MLVQCLYLILLYSSAQGVFAKSQVESSVEPDGFLKPELRILGGERLNKNQDRLAYPFMASLQMEEYHSCGGIMLSNTKVLTAAHCSKTPNNWRVVANIVDLNQIKNNNQHQVSLVKYVVRHPKYDVETNLHDIAVWFLPGNGILGFESNNIKLGFDYNENSIDRPKGEITGWGVTKRGSKVASDVLKHLTLPILKTKLCSKLLKGRGGFIYNSKNHICAGYLNGKADGCQGDSGGPLFVNTTRSNGSKMFTMVGISSFGAGCAIKNSPAVYTRISHYRNFITRTKISNLDSSPREYVDPSSIRELPAPSPDQDSSPPSTGLGGIISNIVGSVRRFIPSFNFFG